jgi:NAD(P)-dependent dehydrogenase (short-subunit alcohol dehydrogenase family)
MSSEIKPLALVTGASSGVGREIALHLSKNFRVLAIARRIDRMKEEFRGIAEIIPLEADLSDPIALDGLLEDWIRRFGIPNVIVNSAGVFTKGTVEELDLGTLNRTYFINSLSPLMITKKFLPEMKNLSWARIVNLTSGAPLNCSAGFSAYSSTKAHLNSWTVTLAKELLDTNVRINLMSPGPAKTEMAPQGTVSPRACLPLVDYLIDPRIDLEAGKFFWLKHEIPLFPDLSGVDWGNATATERFRRVVFDEAQ